MKTLNILVITLMMLSILPMIMADGAGIDGGVTIVIEEPVDSCYEPVIYIDHTARGWYPNDQTIYTAEEYGNLDNGGKYNLPGYDRFAVNARQNYVFTGETLDYYVLIEDENGKQDIDEVRISVDGQDVGQCAQVEYNADELAFGIGLGSFNDTTMETYICRLIVDNTMNNDMEVSVNVIDGADDTTCEAMTVVSGESDFLEFNPSLSLSLGGASIEFGSATAGSVATSNTIYLENSAEDGSGVVMDMYIASQDYFTDPSNPSAICGAGNGIRYDQFSYYATKGSTNSGANNNNFPALGEELGCAADDDEFTELPSHSGEITDMCRIINWQQGSSLLTQGAEMSITFQLDVPEVCEGSFTEGQFYFVGRVI